MANTKSIPTLTEEEAARFWSKVHKGPDCWTWTGCRFQTGYGAFQLRGKIRRASRLAASLSGLLLSDSAWVLHRCDNRACVRPDHLFAGTPKDNVADMIKKGRARWVAPRGERSHTAKLTEAKVLEIRALRSSGVPRADVARMFGVAGDQITRITTRKNWSHVKEAS